MKVIPKKLLRIYKIHFSILLFMFLFGVFHYIKPSFAYTPDGAYRQFGVGFKHKTVFPVWLVSIVLAVVSYLTILYVLVYI